jgi:hypothetical protein
MDTKVLFITSIYSNLWGTNFGGRACRKIHYKESLLNILNMSPTHCICFTSKEEYDELCEFYYTKHKIKKELLEIIVFDLTQSKYYDLINEKKDLERMKTFDRCFEIQYNKFFWFELVEDINKYDKVYWIDAGLSHGGLFPDKYKVGTDYNSHFRINLFKPEFLHKIDKKTEDKIIIFSKNNTGKFFWSQTIPHKYYEKYKIEKHIVGAMFGGKPELYQKYVEIFKELLVKLLNNESELYMEEQIMSCLYFNNIDLFTTEEFDDWYQRNPNDQGIKYFYNIFE